MANPFIPSHLLKQNRVEDLEETIIDALTYKVPFFKRFVDDCLTATPEEKINDIIKKINNYHPKLKFTCELEKQNKINFLDPTLTRTNTGRKTIWYTKPTWRGRYSNFAATVPITHKEGVISGIC